MENEKSLNEIDTEKVSGGTIIIQKLKDGNDYHVYDTDNNLPDNVFDTIEEDDFTNATPTSIRASALPKLKKRLMELGLPFVIRYN